MRVAAIYDIHANLPALEAVLAEIRDAGVDRIVVGGDVLPGPMPVESLDALARLEVPTSFLTGNGDREVLAQMTGETTPWFQSAREEWRAPVRWTARQLGLEHLRLLERWPASVRLDVDGLGSVFFCHATPRNDWEIFTRVTPDAVLAPVFADVGCPVVVCGHTHMQFDRFVGATRIVNAGSVGMPYGQADACWLLLDAGVDLRRTRYDVETAGDRLRRTPYPGVDDFIAHCLMEPPPEEQMIELFARAELT